MAPDWSGAKAKEGGRLRWSANWVAGPDIGSDHNRGRAVVNPRLAVGVTVILPGNSHVPHTHPHPETHVVMRGSAVVDQEGQAVELGRLDAIYFPPRNSARFAKRWQ